MRRKRRYLTNKDLGIFTVPNCNKAAFVLPNPSIQKLWVSPHPSSWSLISWLQPIGSRLCISWVRRLQCHTHISDISLGGLIFLFVHTPLLEKSGDFSLFQGIFQRKLAGKHNKPLPSKCFCIVQIVVSFRGLWLNILLRLQLWLCPDRLISQRHKTVALKRKNGIWETRDRQGLNTSQLHLK